MNCRTTVFYTNEPEKYQKDLKKLNKSVSFYFVLSDKTKIFIERASLINGTENEIKKEKDFLIDYLLKRKEEKE